MSEPRPGEVEFVIEKDDDWWNEPNFMCKAHPPPETINFIIKTTKREKKRVPFSFEF